MNINILRYFLFGIARGQEVDRNFSWSINEQSKIPTSKLSATTYA